MRVEVRKDQPSTLLDGKLIQSADSLEGACLGLLEKAEAVNFERITLFSGNNISPEEVNHITEKIKTAYPSHEIEVHEGNQPHYQVHHCHRIKK